MSTRSVDALGRRPRGGARDERHLEEAGLRLCAEIDERVSAFLDRPIEGEWPYLWIDATYLKVRQNGRIVSVAVIVAVGVNADGRREVLSMDIGPSEAEPFWTAFLRKLARRGLRGVKLVVSDAHEGIRAAVSKTLETIAPVADDPIIGPASPELALAPPATPRQGTRPPRAGGDAFCQRSTPPSTGTFRSTPPRWGDQARFHADPH